MSVDKADEVLTLLQPELLTSDQLMYYIKSRCPKLQNLTDLSKDELLKLFRQMILPLPQRRYRQNRRGRLLTARRMKSGLECGEEDKSLENGKRPTDQNRLKPPPDSCTPKKIRIATMDKKNQNEDIDKIVINDRKKSSSEETRISTEKGKCGQDAEASSSQKIVLKRSSSSTEKSDREPNKKQRIAIKWP